MASQARNTCAGCLWLCRAFHEPNGEQRRCYHGSNTHFYRARCLRDTACDAFKRAVSSADHPQNRERKRK